MDDVALSRRLAYVLRHRPDSVGLELDAQGWVDIELLASALTADGAAVTRADLERVVATSDKRRYELREGRVRAQQGHSVAVDLGLEPRVPPPELWHGTVARSLPSILRQGLRPGSRQHVHLSATRETALTVGRRRGDPVVLVVDAAAAHAAGRPFLLSGNGVWLTPSVAPEHLRVEAAGGRATGAQ